MMHAIQVLACPAEFKPLLVSPGCLSVLIYWLFILDISILDSLKKKNFRSVSVCPNLEVLACYHQWSFVAWHHHFSFSIANSHLGSGSCELKSCKMHPSCCCYRWLLYWSRGHLVIKQNVALLGPSKFLRKIWVTKNPSWQLRQGFLSLASKCSNYVLFLSFAKTKAWFVSVYWWSGCCIGHLVVELCSGLAAWAWAGSQVCILHYRMSHCHYLCCWA
jgi:hypothetical protein